jgi:hypothetical protein
MKKESCKNKGGEKKGRRQLPEQGNRRCEGLQDLYCSEHQVRNQFWKWWKRCDHSPWLSPAPAVQLCLAQASCCHLPSISTQQ